MERTKRAFGFIVFFSRCSSASSTTHLGGVSTHRCLRLFSPLTVVLLRRVDLSSFSIDASVCSIMSIWFCKYEDE